MANASEIQDWVTLGAAVVAAVASVMALRDKSDSIKVGFGPMHPPISPGESLYVISQRDHFMQVRDYGFIDGKGRLLSLPQMSVDEPGDDAITVSCIGDFSKHGGIIEYGPVTLRDKQIGAYAITAGQDFYRIAFHHDVAWIKRFWLRIKIALGPQLQ